MMTTVTTIKRQTNRVLVRPVESLANRLDCLKTHCTDADQRCRLVTLERRIDWLTSTVRLLDTTAVWRNEFDSVELRVRREEAMK